MSSVKSILLIVPLFALSVFAGGAAVYAYLNIGRLPPPASPLESTRSPSTALPESDTATNVRVEAGVQIIEIQAKGGYTPEFTKAKAGVPTVLHLVTNNTFDCASFVAIPSMHYQARLPLTGTTEVELSAQVAGTTLTGICGMAMYRFDIEFSA